MLPVMPVVEETAVVPLPGTQRLAPGERMETFELTPVVRFAAEPRTEPRQAVSIEALLRRLEQGAGRRAAQG